MPRVRRKTKKAFLRNDIYLPLNENTQEIRLLTLLPGELDDELQIDLDIVALIPDIPLHFEALSYAWGPIDDPSQVFVGPKRQHLSITRNLADALRHLRYGDAPRTLWVDAICVNQADLPERGSQVKRMAETYTRASRVVVWLGRGTP